MPRNHRGLDSQVRQINKMFYGSHVIEIAKPCSLHNRKGSIDIYKLGKSNSIDEGYVGTDRLLYGGVQRRAKSVDHTGLRKSNRNSIASTSDLFPNYTLITTTDRSTDRRRSYFDGMEHPSDFPSQLRNFQTSLSLSKQKLNGSSSARDTTKNGDSNNNLRSSISPEKLIAADAESYLRKPKRLSFDVNIDSSSNGNNNLTTPSILTTNVTNRKLSASSTDSLEYARSPSRRFSTHSTHSFGSNSSAKQHYFDSADIEKEVSSQKIVYFYRN